METLKKELKTLIENKYFIFVITIIIFFLSSLLQLIPIQIFNLDTDNISSDVQILLNMFSNTICMIILVLLYKKDLKHDFKIFKKQYKTILDKAFGIWVLGLVAMAVSNLIINYISPNDIANNEKAIRGMIKVSPYLMLISTSLIAPIIEELTFRAAFKKIFKSGIAFILVSAFVFGSLHVISMINSLYDYLYLIPYCSLGFAFSYMYYKTNNIMAPIIMHITHNFIITLLNIFAIGMIIW